MISSNKEIDSTKSICVWPTLVGATKNPKEEDKSSKMQRRLTIKNTPQDYEVGEQSARGEYLTFIRNDNEDVTSIENERYNIDLQWTMTVPQRSCKKENRDDSATRHLHIYVKTHEGNIKAIATSSRDVQLAMRTD